MSFYSSSWSFPDYVDEAFLRQCPELKIISAALKGFDNFDVTACTRHGVWFTMVPDLLTIAKRLTGFDVEVNYFDLQPLCRCKAQALCVRPVSMDQLLARSDYLICAIPLTLQTRHLINQRTIADMKRGCYLINVGRGSCVDEDAVDAALGSEHLAGYAADVFEMEDWLLEDRPRTIHPSLLAQKEKTVLTPHLGSAVNDIRRKIALEAASSIIQFLDGHTPAGAVNRINAAVMR